MFNEKTLEKKKVNHAQKRNLPIRNNTTTNTLRIIFSREFSQGKEERKKDTRTDKYIKTT